MPGRSGELSLGPLLGRNSGYKSSQEISGAPALRPFGARGFACRRWQVQAPACAPGFQMQSSPSIYRHSQARQRQPASERQAGLRTGTPPNATRGERRRAPHDFPPPDPADATHPGEWAGAGQPPTSSGIKLRQRGGVGRGAGDTRLGRRRCRVPTTHRLPRGPAGALLVGLLPTASLSLSLPPRGSSALPYC